MIKEESQEPSLRKWHLTETLQKRVIVLSQVENGMRNIPSQSKSGWRICKGPKASESGGFQHRENHCCWTQSWWVEAGRCQITQNSDGHVGAMSDSGL